MSRTAYALTMFGCFVVYACSSETSEPKNDDATGGTNNTSSGGTNSATGGKASGGSAGASNGSGGSSNAGQNGSGGSSSGGQDSGTGGSEIGTGGSSGEGNVGGKLEECTTKPSIDRLQQWLASGEGETKPKTGTLVVKQGADVHVAKVEFLGSDWHVIPVYVANKLYDKADLSASSGFTLTYSATADFYVQIRPASKWDGGAQYATAIPGTGGKVETRTFSFAKEKWQSLFDAPALTYEQTLKEVTGFVFVGNTPNVIEFRGLRFDGYVPPCL